MASGTQTLIVLPVTMWKKGIKTNNFVRIDCLSTLFGYRLHYIKVRVGTSGFEITFAVHADPLLKKIKLLSDGDARF